MRGRCGLIIIITPILRKTDKFRDKRFDQRYRLTDEKGSKLRSSDSPCLTALFMLAMHQLNNQGQLLKIAVTYVAPLLLVL